MRRPPVQSRKAAYVRKAWRGAAITNVLVNRSIIYSTAQHLTMAIYQHTRLRVNWIAFAANRFTLNSLLSAVSRVRV